MATRKTREQEELEAELRAVRRFQRTLDDIAWKHETFFPTLDAYLEGRKVLDKSKPVFELEGGE